jgi:hypothetical protein
VPLRGLWVQKEVLIVVKTYPNPSSKYREIVCTAGVDVASGELIRLFPIPYRSLNERERFHKWQYVRLEVRKSSDPRPESYEVRLGSIEPGEFIATHGNGWARRWSYIAPLLSPSVEALEADRVSRGVSLGIVKPDDDVTMTIVTERKPEYDARQKRKLLGDFGHDTLFGDFRNYNYLLEKMPWRFRYHFSKGPSGEKFNAYFEDWEIGEAYRKWRRELYPDPNVLKQKILKKFLDDPRAAGNLYLFLGTHSRHRHQWLAIGIVMPRFDHRSMVVQPSLFDT